MVCPVALTDLCAALQVAHLVWGSSRYEHPFIQVLLKVQQLHTLLWHEGLLQQLPVAVNKHEVLTQNGVFVCSTAGLRGNWEALVCEAGGVIREELGDTRDITLTDNVPHSTCAAITADNNRANSRGNSRHHQPSCKTQVVESNQVDQRTASIYRADAACRTEYVSAPAEFT